VSDDIELNAAFSRPAVHSRDKRLMAASLPELPPPESIAGLFARFLSERRIASFGFAPLLRQPPLGSDRVEVPVGYLSREPGVVRYGRGRLSRRQTDFRGRLERRKRRTTL
jgi:hypothetical protein